MSARDDQKGFGVLTLGGKYINYFSPDWRQIDFRDAAHNLSRIVRYTGGLPYDVDYTIIDHQLAVAGLVDKMHGSRRAIAWAAIHDVPEAWTNDIPAPLKSAIRVHTTIFDVIERSLEEALLIAAGLEDLTQHERDIVHAADKTMGEVEHKEFRLTPGNAYCLDDKVDIWLNLLRTYGVNVDNPGIRMIQGELLEAPAHAPA